MSTARPKLNILVVENEGLLRLSVMDMIEDMGHIGFAAPNANAALKFLGAGTPVDVMLIDIGLPDMDGRDLAKSARRLRPDMHMVFATGHGLKPLVEAALDVQAKYLPKPYRMHDLELALDGLVMRPSRTA